jgi:hypothetical protein
MPKDLKKKVSRKTKPKNKNAVDSPDLDSSPNPPATSFEGARDFTVSNSIINTVAGNFNQPIFKFDGSACSG